MIAGGRRREGPGYRVMKVDSQMDRYVCVCVRERERLTKVKWSQVAGAAGEPGYEVMKVESQTDRDRRAALSLNLAAASKVPPEPIQTPQDPEEESGKWFADCEFR